MLNMVLHTLLIYLTVNSEGSTVCAHVGKYAYHCKLNWTKWTNLLKGFTIMLMFLWIVWRECKVSADVEEKLREMRTGPMTLWLKHVTYWVSINQINKDLADTLAQICASRDNPP